MNNDISELKNIAKARMLCMQYQDLAYIRYMRNINEGYQRIMADDLGSQFVQNCGRDIAGEIVRNCFDTSSFYITVDQLAQRILTFTYDDEYDPLAKNGGAGETVKNVLNQNSVQGKWFKNADLQKISTLMDSDGAKVKLFTEDRNSDGTGKATNDYKNSLVTNVHRNENGELVGTLRDEITGVERETKLRKDGKNWYSAGFQADHVQTRAGATYNSLFVTESGRDQLKVFWNSSDNLQLIEGVANNYKGDARVCKVDGKIVYMKSTSKEYDEKTDITSKATPEQITEAMVHELENTNYSDREQEGLPSRQKLQESGYLDKDGKVTPSAKKALLDKAKVSMNKESRIILENTKYGAVATYAAKSTVGNIGKIITGQILYYAAPPIVYELRCTLAGKKQRGLEDALEDFGERAKRVGVYVFNHLKDIFKNITANSLKSFIKSFMDLLINLVKATVKKILKMAKSLVLSTVDAVRIIMDPNASAAQKADSVFNLFGVTITSCVVELLFELLSTTLHIPEPFDDIIFGPLQILTTIVCTNLTMLILQKADLFDVRYGFKLNQVRQLFADERAAFINDTETAIRFTDEYTRQVIFNARQEVSKAYYELTQMDVYKQSALETLERLGKMFSLNLDLENEWLRFIGFEKIPPINSAAVEVEKTIESAELPDEIAEINFSSKTIKEMCDEYIDLFGKRYRPENNYEKCTGVGISIEDARLIVCGDRVATVVITDDEFVLKRSFDQYVFRIKWQDYDLCAKSYGRPTRYQLSNAVNKFIVDFGNNEKAAKVFIQLLEFIKEHYQTQEEDFEKELENAFELCDEVGNNIDNVIQIANKAVEVSVVSYNEISYNSNIINEKINENPKIRAALKSLL